MAMPRPRRRRKIWCWSVLAMLAMLVIAMVWLNGPGLRWLGPKIAAHYLQKAGLSSRFTLTGSFTGGITVTDLRLESDHTQASLSVSRMTPSYRIRNLFHGQLEGLEFDGLHVEVRLGVTGPSSARKPPVGPDQLARTLGVVRQRLVPLDIDLRNLSCNITRDGRPVVKLESSSLRHDAGDAAFMLGLGVITVGNGRAWPAQTTRIVWQADELSMTRLDPLPGVSVRDLVLQLPANAWPAAMGTLHVDDAIFDVSATNGFSSVNAKLRTGRLHSDQVAQRLARKTMPVAATLTGLSLDVDGLLPDARGATGTAHIVLVDGLAAGWDIPALDLEIGWGTAQATVVARGQALGTGVELTAAAPLTHDGGRLQIGEILGHCQVADVRPLLATLSTRTKVIDPEAAVPPASVGGEFRIPMMDLRPAGVNCDLTLQPADPEAASPLHLKAGWRDKRIQGELTADEIGLTGFYDYGTSDYSGRLVCGQFHGARLARWLAVVRAHAGGALDLTGVLNGHGNVKQRTHSGELELVRAEWAREGVPPITASTTLNYQWPGSFTASKLRLQANDQTLSADLKLAAGLLDVEHLQWYNRESRIADGTASIPVPADFSNWHESLAKDERPVKVALESQVLSLALLKDWLPAAARIDSRSTGRVRVNVAGTYALPQVDASVDVMGLRSPEQPKLPPADVRVMLVGRDGRFTLDGKITAADWPAAVMTGSMAWRPVEWAKDPAAISSEKIMARFDLPRLDLARLASWMPFARKVSGSLTGNLDISGEVGKPLVKGKLSLTGGSCELKDGRYPNITGLGAAVDLAVDRITLKNLQATVAGGSLRGSGWLALANGKPGDVDLRLTGDHLPLVRNDSLIMRANSNLRLAGSWQRAAITGNIGLIDGLFYRDIELLPIGTPFTTPSAAALPKIDTRANAQAVMPEPFRNWSLNVVARTDNPFLIRGNLATGQLDMNLRIGGNLGSPAPDGVIQLTQLRAGLPFSTLNVSSGIARFTPATGFDPQLDIRGTAEPRPYQVNLFVSGRASDPQLQLTSNPPLPENEIMTLLATGTTTSGLENPQAASSRALQLLVEELRRGRFAVGKQLRPVLGLLDRVEFSLAETDPYTSASFSTATLKLTDRWFLSAGMGKDGDTRVMGIWRITFY